ncbi:replication initiation negative regulator SeqA [Aggregatibacter aphrophilus]|uniref:Negative modulator of initiation of replication n=1 Tax=Aggregatibacter aphrophilus ATCC 33389 TaxID=985008 RepID=A0A448F7F4_AGGAP|nr:replication initiation negative regulator SeqA [Aggregatibacter aphrophilus]KNE85627.1 replication initiation regulator SeqA [Aggregatibacter aphrophilus ATCC 33389]OBY54979.1 replication initiation regulator SeqA [Aggregatibacter aphrophilus]RDE87375.1 replication initiation negative regulator SeqA [Aggregatibacter aphrophilus]VEF41826.1 Negative modulator of initiation of replication [Aggregatibacter aphrophilus ATCC 33389]
MKIIEVDEELYQYIAGNTQSIGESASDILRRLLNLSPRNAYVNLSENQSGLTPSSSNEQTQVTEQPTVFEEEINKPVIRKQSDEVMQKTITKLESLLNSEEFKQENKAVVRFLNILTILYRTNPEGFALATESLQGRTRVYFARDEGTLLMAGNHTKPKQIPDTPYWVITNTNSGRKMLMLEGAMQSMHLPEELIEQVRSYFTAN